MIRASRIDLNGGEITEMGADVLTENAIVIELDGCLRHHLLRLKMTVDFSAWSQFKRYQHANGVAILFYVGGVEYGKEVRKTPGGNSDHYTN